MKVWKGSLVEGRSRAPAGAARYLQHEKLIKYLKPGFKTGKGRADNKFTTAGNTNADVRVF